MIAGAVIINEDSITTQHVSMGTRVTVVEEGFEDEPEEYAIVAVSYTHLDVYKRQALPQQVVEEELEKRQPEKGPEARRQAAENCGGSLGRALQLLEGAEGKGSAVARRFLAALHQGEWQVLTACVEAGSRCV